MNTQRKARHHRHGDILIQTLFFILLIMTVVLSASSLMFSQLNWANHEDNQLRAQLAARGALEIAKGRIKADQSFVEDVVWEREGVDERAVLTFDAGRGVPYSTSNTRSGVAKACWKSEAPLSDGKVLPNAVHLVAVGTCRNARYVAEAEFVFPPFPYALASTGEVLADGKLEIFGVESLAAADTTPDDDKLEGHIVSNSRDAASIVLSAETKVSGDVKSLGGIQANGAEIEGQLLPGQARPADLPPMALERPAGSDPETDRTLYISDFDFQKNPKLRADAQRNLAMTVADATAGRDSFEVTEVRVRVDARNQPLVLNHGVKLNDGALHVDGDVTIYGGITGTGAITATGKITIYGPSSLASDQMALLSGNGVELNGQGLGISKFRGLVATMGDLKADNTEIQGAFISTGSENGTTQLGEAPKMVLKNVKTVHAPDATTMDITVHTELKEMLRTGQGAIGGALGGSQIGLLHEGAFYTFTGDPTLAEGERKAQVQATYQALLGVQGEEHPMKEGSVVLRTASGQYKEASALTGSLKQTVRMYNQNWIDYTNSLLGPNSQIHQIFSIDLNKFTSGGSRMKTMMYH